jgi:hypothetical protein
MRYRCFILIVTAFLLSLTAEGQQLLTIKGVISKKLSVERIPQVLISNTRSREVMISDDLGWFAIKAEIGDTLLFSKFDYTDQKIIITGTGDIPVYMQPVIKLAEVKIQGQTKKQELNDVMADYRKQGTFYDGKPPAMSFLASPLTGLYELFGTTPGRAKRFAAYSKGEIEYAEVRRRYTVQLVKRVTKASDSTARKFMEYYTPSFDDLKEWNDYELIKQIRKSYDYYDKNGDKFKLQELNTPAPLKMKIDTAKSPRN